MFLKKSVQFALISLMMTLSGYGLYAKDAVKVVDRANPEAVAKAFINALIKKLSK